MAKKRMLTVKRKGYTKSDGTKVKGSHVEPSSFKITDRGAPGRGKKVIHQIRKGRMTKCAVKHGYIDKDGKVGDISVTDMKQFAHDLVKCVGDVNTARKMFRAQRILRKRSKDDSFKHKMEVDEESLKNY